MYIKFILLNFLGSLIVKPLIVAPKEEVQWVYRAEAPAQRNSFVIKVEGFMRSGKEISVPIARLPEGMKLTNETLREIFRLATKHTLSKPYAIATSHCVKIAGKPPIYRPNHNGTHSARQAASAQTLLRLITQEGFDEAKEISDSLSEEEHLNLILGAYLLRSGRVDEKNHHSKQGDNYYLRSARIYEAYAKQLGVSQETIDWIKVLIIASCKPVGVRDGEKIDAIPKNKFGFHLVTLAHEMDLVRCFGKNKIETETLPNMKERIAYFLGAENVEDKTSLLFNYAARLCKATGFMLRYCRQGGKAYLQEAELKKLKKGNTKRFIDSSLHGDRCWDYVTEVSLSGMEV